MRKRNIRNIDERVSLEQSAPVIGKRVPPVLRNFAFALICIWEGNHRMGTTPSRCGSVAARVRENSTEMHPGEGGFVVIEKAPLVYALASEILDWGGHPASIGYCLVDRFHKHTQLI